MLMLVFMVGTATTSLAEKSEAETAILPPNTYLVEARVVRVDLKTYAADLVIERVYAGDGALKGQKFTLSDYLWRRFGYKIGKPLSLPLVEGEVGLWWVGCPDSSESKLFSYNDLRHSLPFIYVPFPARLKGGPEPILFASSPCEKPQKITDPFDFDPKRMVEWAEAIERVYKTKGDDERIAFLKKYAGSDNPPLSAWALDTLSRFLEPEGKAKLFTPEGKIIDDSEELIRTPSWEKYVRKDVKSMLEDFADDANLPIYAQIELDDILTRINDDWLKSDRRSKMLQRWEKVKDPVDRDFISGKLKRDASK
jgi:hypothetical protein